MTRIERQAESDDEVRSNIPPNPDDVLAAADDKTDALIRELEEQQREARHSLPPGCMLLLLAPSSRRTAGADAHSQRRRQCQR